MSNDAPLSPLKQALLALQTSQNRVAELEGAHDEPVAIIGMACRLPGSVDGPEEYWSLLRETRTTAQPHNLERWQQCAARLEVTAEQDGIAWGSLLDRVDEFDPAFFGISPREALSMDPQQRLLLEVSWLALENAAISPDSTFGTKTGVYFGLAANDYAQLQLGALRQSDMEPHFASGAGHSVASGRLSYILGWHGPSVSIDTACSSSLVAVQLASSALQHGDCSMALAGGVNLILSAESSIAFSRAGMLSSSGRVLSFGRGDGFVRGEGCGVVVLKRLRAAVAAGDRVLGVIRGSAVNHDGPGSGLTVPNGRAQAMLLRSALQSAGLEPSAVGYVEAHGTGTRLGDPIEAEALGEVFAGPREAPLRIGSVKTNLGHLEAAAGIAGLIKLVLALEHREIPAQLPVGPLSEHVRWSELPLEVATRRPAVDSHRRTPHRRSQRIRLLRHQRARRRRRGSSAQAAAARRVRAPRRGACAFRQERRGTRAHDRALCNARRVASRTALGRPLPHRRARAAATSVIVAPWPRKQQTKAFNSCVRLPNFCVNISLGSSPHRLPLWKEGSSARRHAGSRTVRRLKRLSRGDRPLRAGTSRSSGSSAGYRDASTKINAPQGF